MRARAFEFSPATLDLQVGQAYRIQVTSEDVFHTFTLRDPGGDVVLDIALSGGTTEAREFTPTVAGQYRLFCRPHEGLDMVGTVHVHGEEPSQGDSSMTTPTPTTSAEGGY